MHANILMEKVWMKTLLVIISEGWNFRNFLLFKSNTLDFCYKHVLILLA